MTANDEFQKAMDRYFDGEMSPDEEAAFMETLERDPEMRLRFRQTAEAVRRLERMAECTASDGFLRRVVAALNRREMRFRIRVLSVAAAAAAAVILGASIFLAGFSVDNRAAPYPGGPRAVTFVIDAPEAKSVHLVGDFNQWALNGTPMQRVGNSWQATLKLEAGQYAYQIVLDKADWICDPSAAMQIDDGFGGANSLIVVSN